MKALLAKQKMINKVVLIPEHRIKPNPYQPRRVFDQEKIEQLAASIAQYGLLQPIPAGGGGEEAAGLPQAAHAGGARHPDHHG